MKIRMKLLGLTLLAPLVGMAGTADDGGVFTNLLYATQYYRSPTPLADEWDGDLEALGGYNLDTVQLRLNWRNNERQEGVYAFDDIDRLMDLAEKHGKKVIIKFLLECAPQYVFDKYDGSRVDHWGRKFNGAVNGAYYAGGWLPCFTNPKVAERAAEFVKVVVRRYADRKSIILWNAWNEPRCRPVDECFCDACRAAYGAHLKRRFGTIDRLNDFYGVCEESFERIALPRGGSGYWDAYEFKKFKCGPCIYDELKFVYDAVRTVDKVRPVISHCGCPSGFQLMLNDICNDFMVREAVDGWGTSLALDVKMQSRENRLEYGRLNDFMRAVDPNYTLYEIYPGLGMFFLSYDTVWDMDYKLYGGLACGAKGFNFWQYRSERVGSENDCAGLVRADGSPRPAMDAVRRFGADVKKLASVLPGFYPKRAETCIVFDYNSLMMSLIEDAGGTYDFKKFDNEKSLQYYPRTHKGFYWLMRRNDYAVDYLDVRDLARLSDYKVAYFPNCAMLDPAWAPTLEKFVSNGGILIADEGFGLRQMNTWMNPYDIDCGKIMKARLVERRLGSRDLALAGGTVSVGGYNSEYRVEGAETVLRFADGQPAIQSISYGKGRVYLLGFSLGFAAWQGHEAETSKVLDLMLASVKPAKSVYGRFDEDLEERRLFRGDEQFMFLINASGVEKRVKLVERFDAAYGAGSLRDGVAVVPPRACLILKGKVAK